MDRQFVVVDAGGGVRATLTRAPPGTTVPAGTVGSCTTGSDGITANERCFVGPSEVRVTR